MVFVHQRLFLHPASHVRQQNKKLLRFTVHFLTASVSETTFLKFISSLYFWFETVVSIIVDVVWNFTLSFQSLDDDWEIPTVSELEK